MKDSYTVKEAAEILGSSKSTIHRLLRTELDLFSEVGRTTYRGHQAYTITEQGLAHLRTLLNAPEARQESNQEANQNDSSAPGNESGHFNESHSEAAVLSVLRAELEAKNRQIEALTSALERAQESLQAAQLLHAATAEQLKLLTGPTATQEAQEPQEGNDTTQEPEDAQEQPREPAAPSLRERLRFLFKGK